MPNFAESLAFKVASGAGLSDYIKLQEENPFLFECFLDCLGHRGDIPPERVKSRRARSFRRQFAFFRTITQPPPPKNHCPWAQ